MIEVLVDQTGDLAEDIENVESAILAAKTMCGEAYEWGGGTFKPTVTFSVDGRIVRAKVSEAELRLLKRMMG